MLSKSFKKAISVLNAKSPLLSLPPELRLRIFEYVFGTVRHHVKINGNEKNYHVQLARCEVELDSGHHHAYRKKTLEEASSSPQNPDDSDHIRHLNCYRKWRNKRQTAKAHKRSLPHSLLLTCKTIHSDAALIMWHNHVFELEFFTDDLEKFVARMSSAQRTALRTIAFDVRATDVGQTKSRRVKATPTDAESLHTWRQPMRESFVALSKLQRIELFVDIWPGIEAGTPFVFPGRIDGQLAAGKIHMIGDWIRLLERRDMEDVDVWVEEGVLLQPGLRPSRNPPFPISARRRLEWEEQIRSIVRGRVLEAESRELVVDSSSESGVEL